MAEITLEQMKSLDAEVERLTDLLQGYMRFRHRTVRDVERDLGWGRGTLNRIFSGRSELKLRHVLEIAATLDLNPEEFFHMAYAVLPKGATTVERVVAMLEVLGERAGVKPRSVPPPPQINLESLTPVIEEMMRRLLAETRESELSRAEAPAERKPAAKPRGKRGKKTG